MKEVEKSKLALERFNNGLNCSQSVFSVFAEENGISLDTAKKVACGLGAGMGRLQNTCGAVTGAYMALGLYWDKDVAYPKVQEFSKLFSEKHSHTLCSSLLNCNLQTEDGQKFFSDNNLREEVCNRCVVTAVELVENLI